MSRDWAVHGLDQEDTVVHYDTLDGKTRVEPSNRVPIYAPRFAAVRKVSGVRQHELHERSAGVELPVGPSARAGTDLANTVLQRVQPFGQRSARFGQSFRDRTRTVGVENQQALALESHRWLPYEDFLIIRKGQFDNAEKARLNSRLQAAVAWTHDTAIQVVIDNVAAVEASSHLGLQSIYVFDMPVGKSRLRVVKVASREEAQPGDVIDFTIRFDNVGDQTIGNVTVMDSLNTRLEYVPDSQQCSVKAKFATQANDGESLVLRWEVEEPLKVGAGGVIRFQCRVR